MPERFERHPWSGEPVTESPCDAVRCGGFSLYARQGAMTWRWKSSGDLVTGTQGNRKVTLARAAPKEAGNELTGRRTETGYEATPIRVSGQRTAKLS